MSTQICYPLVHSDSELERLVEQGCFYGELTERLLFAAGIQTGMRVLDVGCGAGDVSFLLGLLVGPRGAVVGLDRSAPAIALAQRRAQHAGLDNVTFAQSELCDFPSPQLFDAAVGRFVLMYQTDPVSTCRHVAHQVRRGGIVAFQEMDCSRWPPARFPGSPLLARLSECFEKTYLGTGAEMQMGMKLPSVFAQAGLPVPQTRVESRLVASPDSPYYRLVAEFYRTLLPAMEGLGVTTASEIDVETLEERLRAEIRAFGTVVMTPPLVGAWARTIV